MVVWKWTETSCTHIVLKDLAFDHIFSFEVNFTYKKNFPQKLLLFLSMYLGSSYKYMLLSMKVFCCWKFYYLHQDVILLCNLHTQQSGIKMEKFQFKEDASVTGNNAFW